MGEMKWSTTEDFLFSTVERGRAGTLRAESNQLRGRAGGGAILYLSSEHFLGSFLWGLPLLPIFPSYTFFFSLIIFGMHSEVWKDISFGFSPLGPLSSLFS